MFWHTLNRLTDTLRETTSQHSICGFFSIIIHQFALREGDNLAQKTVAYIFKTVVYLFKRGFRPADRAFALCGCER
jgi:hypothetical protein